jgi:hypothetical protein
MPLSSQDKLALALTSAGSMRNLAKLVGVSHQKIGRWLREGEAGGAKSIPKDATAAINVAFAFHKDVTKQQAKVDRFPFNPNAPVFIQRPTLRNGQPGERLLATQTEYIKPELRDQIFLDLKKTKQVLAISLRSTVNLKTYLKGKPTDTPKKLREKFKVRGAKDERGRSTLMASFDQREAEKPGSGFVAPINTTMTDFSPRADAQLSIRDINSKLSSKHSPHAIALADQFLIQTLPGQYENQAKPKRQTAAQKRASLIRR